MAAQPKESWPELIGKSGEEAKTVILKERPGLDVQVVPHTGMMTMDYRTDRVRVFVDDNQKVTSAPNCG